MQSLLFSYKDQPRVFVYRNLNSGCWSVKAIEGKNAGHVILHAAHVALHGRTGKGIEFKVSEAGRQRVLREKRKNVHAGAVGYLYFALVNEERYPVDAHKMEIPESAIEAIIHPEHEKDHPAYRKVTYNPYKFNKFVFADTYEPAFINDVKDMDIILNAQGKVYVQSSKALCDYI